MSTKVLLPVDGSDAQLDAARLAGRRLQTVADAEVVLMYAITIPPALLEHGGGGDPEESLQAQRDTARARREWLAEKRTALETDVFAPARAAVREGAGRDDAPKVSVLMGGTRPEGAHIRTFLAELDDDSYDAVVLTKSAPAGADESPYGDLAGDLAAAGVSCEIWLAD